jgi:uncharacterized Zn-binding protein involved in type VI secretion
MYVVAEGEPKVLIDGVPFAFEGRDKVRCETDLQRAG